MTDDVSPRGVWCATLTPLAASGVPDIARLAAHTKRMFAAGVDGIALFGTTGEGQSFSLEERRGALESLLAAGIEPARIIAATGCAALPDTIELTRHATRIGCAGVLIVPPFFFKGVSDAGVFGTYARVIDAVADLRLRLYLYHIPQVSGVPIALGVIQRLVEAYPRTIAGVKDSDGNLAHTRSLLARFPKLAIFVGHEPHLPAALSAGGAGTICGIANLFPRLIRRLHDHALSERHHDDLARVERFITAVGRFPLFAAFKAIQAHLSADGAWEALRLPLTALDDEERRRMLAAVDEAGIHFERDAAGPYEGAAQAARRQL